MPEKTPREFRKKFLESLAQDLLAKGDTDLDQSLSEALEQHDPSLNNSAQATLLGKFETVLFIVFAFVLTPTIARFLMGSDPAAGATGPGGIIFLGGGFIIAVCVAVGLAVFQRNYMRDAYLGRWLINGVVVLWLAYRFTS